MNSLSENIMVIHDVGPVSFKVWVFAMVALYILYFIVATIRDINREKKIELLRQKYEQDKQDESLENI